MSQFLALVWLKWTLFRNSMRSRRAMVSRVVGTLGMLLGLGFALAIAGMLGAAAYFFVSPRSAGESAPLDGFAFLFFIFTLMFMMWALMPLALGGGGRFDPGRMLLYPVSLGKLFIFDLLSDLTSLVPVFAIPVALAVGLGAGLATGHVWAGLAVSVLAIAFGISLSKFVSVSVGALMRTKRTRGEMLIAVLGAVLGMTGALMGQLMPLIQRYATYLEGARWSPSGAAAYALARGLKPGGTLGFASSLATLAVYAFVFVALSYAVALRTARGGGGRKRAAAAVLTPEEAKQSKHYAGWQLPFVSPQFSAVVEKELRYALRNAQLRVVALMAVGLTIVLRMAPFGGGTRRMWGQISQYADGAGAVFSVLYIFTLVSPLSTNLFGYDGAGMRALVLSPVSRRLVLAAKNFAWLFIALLLVTFGVFVGGLVFGDLTPPTLLFAALTFVTTAGFYAIFGNLLSIHFPTRVKFGKRMNRSGVGGLLLVPFFLLLMLPPAVSIFAAHIEQSLFVKYAILAAFAIFSVGLYLLLLPAQARTLERRELEILEAVTGRGGDEDSQVMG